MNFNQLYYLHFAILMPRLLLYSNSGVLSSSFSRSPFITYSSQNPWNFLDIEVIMIKKKMTSVCPFQLKSIRVTFLQ